ncbi:MAG TPA: TolC family protein [Alphaproteobacteria bacterium]|nr:TolC family protein [Alphaproteobacteria bacterium]
MIRLGFIAALLAAGFLPALSVSAELTEGNAVTAIVAPEGSMVDRRRLATERRLNALIVEARQGDGSAILQGFELAELSPRQAALKALVRNLGLLRGRIASEIAAAVLDEARAVFDPVLTASANYSSSLTYQRLTYASKHKRVTEIVAAGDNDSGGDVCFAPGDNADANDTNCFRVVFGEDSPVASIQYDQFRPEGHKNTKVTASEASTTGKTKTYTLATSIAQQLPWGPSLMLAYDAVYKNTKFINNPGASGLETFGSYDRPWTSNLSLSLSLPLPFTRNFGSFNGTDMALRLREIDRQVAAWQVQILVNDTLRDVELAFWTLIGRVKALETVRRDLETTERLVSRTERLYALKRITRYDHAQVVSQRPRAAADWEQALSAYVAAANNLAQLLGSEGRVLYLPVAYSETLERLTVPTQDLDSLRRNHPQLLQSALSLRRAELQIDAATVALRPDLALSYDAKVGQSNSVFGYRYWWYSATDIEQPDSTTQTASLVYNHAFGRRSDRAGHDAARYRLERLQAQRDITENSLLQEVRDALTAVESARRSIALARQRQELASEIYAAASRLHERRQVTEYEITQQLNGLLAADTALIQAQIAGKQGETRLLASLGILARAYGQRTALTNFDRGRLKRLESVGILRLFGEGR